jgi:Family of unknown function (DUF5670)
MWRWRRNLISGDSSRGTDRRVPVSECMPWGQAERQAASKLPAWIQNTAQRLEMEERASRHKLEFMNDVTHFEQTSSLPSDRVMIACMRVRRIAGVLAPRKSPRQRGADDMLGLIAAVLIVMWLLGMFAFHVTSGLIHILLVIGVVVLVLHLMRGRSVTA